MTVIEKYGWYDKSIEDVHRELIFVCRKSDEIYRK